MEDFIILSLGTNFCIFPDVTICSVKIFKLVLGLYRTGNSMVRSTACHCFGELLMLRVFPILTF